MKLLYHLQPQEDGCIKIPIFYIDDSDDYDDAMRALTAGYGRIEHKDSLPIEWDRLVVVHKGKVTQ